MTPHVFWTLLGLENNSSRLQTASSFITRGGGGGFPLDGSSIKASHLCMVGAARFKPETTLNFSDGSLQVVDSLIIMETAPDAE